MFRYMFSSFLAQLIHPKMGHPNYHFAKLFYIFPEAFPLPFSSPDFSAAGHLGEYDHPIAILGAGMGGLMTSLDFLRPVGTGNRQSWDNQAMTR